MSKADLSFFFSYGLHFLVIFLFFHHNFVRWFVGFHGRFSRANWNSFTIQEWEENAETNIAILPLSTTESNCRWHHVFTWLYCLEGDDERGDVRRGHHHKVNTSFPFYFPCGPVQQILRMNNRKCEKSTSFKKHKSNGLTALEMNLEMHMRKRRKGIERVW